MAGMKSIAVTLLVLFAASVLSAQKAPVAQATDPKATAIETVAPKAPVGKAATTATTATPAKKVEKKKEELPKIPGTVINRPNGTFLGLEVVGGKFKLTFYDKKHKPMAVDVTRGSARWPNKLDNTPSDFRTVLNPSGTALIGVRPVLPPLVFNVYITLIQVEGEEAKAVENYTVPFKG